VPWSLDREPLLLPLRAPAPHTAGDGVGPSLVVIGNPLAAPHEYGGAAVRLGVGLDEPHVQQQLRGHCPAGLRGGSRPMRGWGRDGLAHRWGLRDRRKVRLGYGLSQ